MVPFLDSIDSTALSQIAWKIFSLRVSLVLRALLNVKAFNMSLLFVGGWFIRGGVLLGVHKNGRRFFSILLNYICFRNNNLKSDRQYGYF